MKYNKPIILRRRKLGLGSCRGIRDASTTGIDFIRNDKRFPANVDLVFRWGCTSNLPKGVAVVNKASAIHWVADKRSSRMILSEAGLAPVSWGSINDLVLYDVSDSYILRRATHHQGRYLHHFQSGQEENMEAVANMYGEGNYYISEYIPKVAEYRVFICQGRVVWVANKTPGNPDDVAWNVAEGGRFDNVRWGDWPLRAVRVAREAFLLSGLDFGGVDVMVGPDGRCYVLEINSAPSQTSPYRQSCTTKAFDYIVENGKEPIPVVEERGDWKKFIHPALSEQSIMVS